MHLGELRKGQKCKLITIHSMGKLKQKLLDMGFIFGASIEVVREAPLYDPMELRIQNYLVSLRRSEASLLEVEVL
ncbi:FeoA family protein [Sulfurospirillum barnesii]|uniref:Fe2+ transport system protein A n=1 Tax=Sulfurospirillum barnesii (strain ATCC 700032 / DSM 10660 / SES-3) TaxID=760154 RepID=I3XY85_SULBS|nr:FeoA family protein [Sulfurospirillum barnesii]AFL68909.1 Fe2+ transport system protein A [Sulfurospirillum barnesii SES-3]